MRKINEYEYDSFTISNGWNLTLYSWQKALREWNNMNAGILYGNKKDGSRAIIDSK